MLFFDSHAHYDDTAFDADRDELLASLPGKGVGIVVNMGCSPQSAAYAIRLSETYPYFYAGVGIHPGSAAQYSIADVTAIEELAAHRKVCCIGEIGLDYHWPEPDRDAQRALFHAQLTLAARLSLPVCVHERDAHGECMEILAQYPSVTGVVHCFSGSAEMALELVRRGWYIGFTGAATFHNNRKLPRVAAAIPLDRMLIETDCPYMAPEPYRGQRCDSSMLIKTAAALAQMREIPVEELCCAVWENGARLFGIDARYDQNSANFPEIK